MTNSNLKTLAIITMVIDHLGAIFFPEIMVLRMIGRLAFPIFAFLLVEGYFHTGDVKKYLVRLGAFAFVSELPFDLAFFNQPIYLGHQNIFFTLFLALLSLRLIDRMKGERMFVAWLGFFGLCLLAVVMKTDYDLLGMMTVLFFYMYRDEKRRALGSVAALHIVYGLLGAGLFTPGFQSAHAIQAMASFAVLFIWQYNGEKGGSLKYVFYTFYPGHLLAMALINYIL